MKFSDYIKAESSRIWRDSSAKHQRDVLKQIERFSSFADHADRDIADFLPRDIYSFMDALIESGLSKASANRYMSAISKVFKHATEMEDISHPPKCRWYKTKSNRVRYFTDSECKQIEEFFDGHKHSWMKQVFLIGINTGMRLGEITQIGSSVNIETDADGSKWLFLPQTKNGDQRYVPLNRIAQKAIQELGGCVSDHYSHRTFYDAWEDCRYAVAKNDKEFVFHVCRHTCATRLANDLGAQTLIIGKMLGHRSEATTAKYVKAKASTLRDFATALEKVA